ncbi:hypothetical protein BC829DRAFT_95469 [Chytridium lagenaria]|nr:hypothetical protein BC829DRAFT_95469 [Chytridium lagenaria]
MPPYPSHLEITLLLLNTPLAHLHSAHIMPSQLLACLLGGCTQPRRRRREQAVPFMLPTTTLSCHMLNPTASLVLLNTVALSQNSQWFRPLTRPFITHPHPHPSVAPFVIASSTPRASILRSWHHLSGQAGSPGQSNQASRPAEKCMSTTRCWVQLLFSRDLHVHLHGELG